MANELVSLFPRPNGDKREVKVWQGVVEAWDGATGENTIRVAGGVLLNINALKAGSATLAVGDVVNLLSVGGQWILLGNVTTPGDPGTVPTWPADITALGDQVETINTVTIPAVQNDVTIVQGDVIELGTDVATAQTTANNAATAASNAQTTADSAATAASAAQTAAANAQSAADAAQADADAAATAAAAAQAEVDAILPITETKISDNAITTPKINTGAITAAKIAADAVTASKILAGSITGDRLTAGTITATQLAAGAVTAAKIAAGTITANELATGAVTADEIAAGAITASKLSADAITGKTITGGLWRTATSGKRVEVDTANQVRFYSGIANEDFPGILEASVVDTQYASTRISSPVVNGSPQGLFILGSRSDTNSSTAFLYSDEIQLNGLNTSMLFSDSGQVQLDAAEEMYLTSTLGGIRVEGAHLKFNDDDVAITGPACRAYLSSVQTTVSGTYLNLTNWTFELSGGISYAGGVFTLPKTGQYMVSAGIAFASGGTGSTAGIRWAQLFRGSTSLALGTTNASSTGNVAQASFAREISATAGDGVILKAFQDSAANRALVVGASFTYIQIKYVGP
jgi:hypothetical protein